MNTKIKIPENPVDLINVVFTQLEITYHNQFHKAFADSDSLKLAKQLWLKKLSLFKNEIIFKSIDDISFIIDNERLFKRISWNYIRYTFLG